MLKALVLIWHYFYKSQNYFGNYFTKPKIIFWQEQLLYAQSPNANLTLFLQSPNPFWQLFYKAQNNILAKTITFCLNTNLAPIYKSPNIIGIYFHKAQMLLWHIFTKFKYYFDTCFTYTKSLTHGKYKLLIYQKIFLSQNLWELCLFFHNQLTTKAHEYHPWQNSSFCSDDQAQRKLDYKAQLDWPSPHTKSSS